ncbi:DoxX family protein [Streptomyces arboris]|uniref:DoxX family protein n=1 Tax=Streptomyces arboris TaxID=2600619 RepID=A0A5N5EFJ6_9ACTN|nr:DoxX family protein [Streptomyces arboris]KAB2589485.1 DoxX family protein [Streptomyces arboris]
MSSSTVEPTLPPPDRTTPEPPSREAHLARTQHHPPVGRRPPSRLADLVDVHALALLRATVGIVFVGFGVLKLFPSASPAEQLAVDAATKMTLGLVPETVLLLSLAALETAIGIGLIVGRRLLRPALVAFFLHMGGVFSTLALLPDAMWQPHSPAPTMEGQYVVKNVVLVAVCLVVAANEWVRHPRPRRTAG